MSNITEPVTFSDLQVDFFDKTGLTSSATNLVIAKRYLNTGLVNMHLNPGHKFPWAEKRGVVLTHATYSTGTVSITTATSRTAVTGASTAWNTAVTGYGFNNARAGGKIKFSGALDHYIVSSVSSDTALTLASTYVGDDLSGASYTYWEDEYALASDFLRFVDIQNFNTEMNIPLIGRTDFRRWFPRNDLSQRPQVATQIQLSFSSTSAPQHRVAFHPAPDQVYQIPYWYVTNKLAVSSAGVEAERMSSDTDEPIVPKGKRQAVTLYALYEYFLYKKDDVRAAEIKSEYATYIQRIAGEVTPSDARPQFYVPGRGSGRTGNGRFGLGGDRFDTIRDGRRWR